MEENESNQAYFLEVKIDKKIADIRTVYDSERMYEKLKEIYPELTPQDFEIVWKESVEEDLKTHIERETEDNYLHLFFNAKAYAKNLIQERTNSKRNLLDFFKRFGKKRGLENKL